MNFLLSSNKYAIIKPFLINIYHSENKFINLLSNYGIFGLKNSTKTH